MAAYAALVSLMNTMEQILNHPRHSACLDKYQIESLGEKVDFLLDFIESYNYHGGSKEAELLESQIVSVAQAAEDVIESHIVDQIHAGSTKKSLTCLLRLEKIIVDVDSIKEKVMKVKEEKGFKDQQPTDSMPTASSRPLTTGKTTMVGLDGYLNQLMDVLTRQQSGRQIISIIGMGGIGKTTLARNIYENSVIMQHFDIRAWATVSQECSIGGILSELLSCQGKFTRGTDDELGEQLYKSLLGRRYLITLDDLWSTEVWDKIKFFFPNSGESGRVVLTTRLSNVANHCGSSCFITMNILDEDKSWNLFCEKAFPQQGCPPELDKIGKMIVKKCKGLPLSIVVIGGHLGKSLRTQEYWENVMRHINSILKSEDDEHCLDILSLSYSHLPVHLKPCFLYMGIFPEDHEICVSRLIKLWVAEGFLITKTAQSLEEVAEVYLKDLIDRNLILVRRLGRNGKIKTCNIHDLLRELCLRVAEKEKFLCIMRVLDTPQAINMGRRIVTHESIPVGSFTPLVRTLICPLIFKRDRLSCDFRLLRVLDVVDMDSLEANFQQVNLRYIDCDFFHPLFERHLSLKLSSSISLLWNLQTLIIRTIFLQIEIWEMLQLRHLEVSELCLPDPPPSDRVNQQEDFVVLRNLHTLVEIKNLKLSEEVCKRIPNIKKLHIRYDDFSGECQTNYYSLNNLDRLHKLQSLNCYFYEAPKRDHLVQNLTFPSLLQKLSLINCGLHWEDLTMIGSLPHLEVLKLKSYLVVGSEWNPVEGEFPRLKFLGIYWCTDLICWNADTSHFPVLEQLVLDGVYKLDEIPSGIREIPTLRFIRLHKCSESAAISAMKILVEQESLGNDGLQVRVQFYLKEEEESFREKVEAEGLTSNNLRLDHYGF